MSKMNRNDLCLCGSGKKYKHCCINNPNSIQFDIQRATQNAWKFFEEGFFEEALKISDQILTYAPQHLLISYLKGLIYLKDGQIDLAITGLSMIHKKAPPNPELLTNLGFAHHEKGNLSLAKSYYEEAIQLNPSYLNAYYNLHAILIDENKLSEAIDVLEKLISYHVSDEDALFMLGMIHSYMTNDAEAEIYFKKLVEASSLIQARIEAWQYLKSSSKTLPKLTGSIIEIFKLALDQAKVKGQVLEFGVRHGNSIQQLAKLSNQPVHGFDSFEGLPEAWHEEAKGSYSTKGAIPKVASNVSLHQGWFNETLPPFIKENPSLIRLLNIDCDIYSSTKTVLDLLAPQIQSGTIIIFDEYIGNLHWKEDEFKAFQEAVKTYQWAYEYLAFSFFTKQVVVKIL
jgi:tetratricopeptide (TPR) repeat protein